MLAVAMAVVQGGGHDRTRVVMHVVTRAAAHVVVHPVVHFAMHVIDSAIHVRLVPADCTVHIS